MAAYDYRCKECRSVFEITASISDYDAGLDVACPRCGSNEVARMISAAGFVTGGGSTATSFADPADVGPSCACGAGGCGH